MPYEVITGLKLCEALAQAIRYFGPRGEGLQLVCETSQSPVFQGGGGHVAIRSNLIPRPFSNWGRMRGMMRCNKQHLDSLRRKDSLRGTETTEISVRLENYCASHFEGSANLLAASLVDGVCPSIPAPHRETGSWPTDLDVGISLVLGFEHRIDAGKPELGLPLAVRV